MCYTNAKGMMEDIIYRRKGQTMAIKSKLPIGIEDFKRIRSEGFYYVDKTGLIRDFLEMRHMLTCSRVQGVLENP